MKTSTSIQPIANFVGYEKAVELVGKAGFSAWDFSLFYLARYNYKTRQVTCDEEYFGGDNCYKTAKLLRKIGEDYGMVCNQSHAPFPSHVKGVKDNLKRAIECTAIAGGNICIVHPVNYYSATENANFYREFVEFGKQHGVKIATENMFGGDRFTGVILPHACANPKSALEHLNALNDDYFVFCLDIGHAEMQDIRTSSVEMIYAIKDKIQALHIHDNDLKGDYHATPFTMSVNYEPIVKALKDIGYNGYLTLECDAHFSRGGYTAETVEEGVKTMYDSVKRLNEMF